MCVLGFVSAVKAHVRKGHALLGMKDTVRAGQAFEKAMDLDPQSVVSVLAFFYTQAPGYNTVHC